MLQPSTGEVAPKGCRRLSYATDLVRLPNMCFVASIYDLVPASDKPNVIARPVVEKEIEEPGAVSNFLERVSNVFQQKPAFIFLQAAAGRRCLLVLENWKLLQALRFPFISSNSVSSRTWINFYTFPFFLTPMFLRPIASPRCPFS